MKRISKLLKIRFFLLLIFGAIGYFLVWERIPENASKIAFKDEMIPKANYNEINLQRIGLQDEFEITSKQIKDTPLATTNYLVFTDAYLSSKELKKMSKIYTKTTLHKTNAGEKTAYFLESHLLSNKEELKAFEAVLLDKNITYKVMKVAG